MGWVNAVIDAAKNLGVPENLLLETAGLPAGALSLER